MSWTDAMPFHILMCTLIMKHNYVSHPVIKALSQAEEKLGIVLKEKQREAVHAEFDGKTCFMLFLRVVHV